jgi:hypothetical protein
VDRAKLSGEVDMPAPRTKKLKKTSFVPRGLFVGAIATGVIPLCACGGSVAQALTVAKMAFDGGDGDAGLSDAVAAIGFDTGVFTVAQQAFDAGEDTGIGFTVAACCFDASVGVADAAFGVAADAFVPDSPILGVAMVGFDGGPDASDGGLIIGVPPVAFDGGH